MFSIGLTPAQLDLVISTFEAMNRVDHMVLDSLRETHADAAPPPVQNFIHEINDAIDERDDLLAELRVTRGYCMGETTLSHQGPPAVQFIDAAQVEQAATRKIDGTNPCAEIVSEPWQFRRDSSMPFQTWHPTFKLYDVVEVKNVFGDTRIDRVWNIWWGYDHSDPEGVVVAARLHRG